jgi:hypothetical protein
VLPVFKVQKATQARPVSEAIKAIQARRVYEVKREMRVLPVL